MIFLREHRQERFYSILKAKGEFISQVHVQKYMCAKCTKYHTYCNYYGQIRLCHSVLNLNYLNRLVWHNSKSIIIHCGLTTLSGSN